MESAVRQTTLGHKVSCSGIGLHSGSQVGMTVYPAQAHTGIVFRRVDVPTEHSFVPARFDAVCATHLGTTIANRHGVTVSTIEHLMAALWGAGLDNAMVELDGPEVPIMDGSAEPFVFMLECAGVVNLAAPRRVLRLRCPIEVRDSGSVAVAMPNPEGEEGCVVSIEIDFGHKMIDRQTSCYDFSEVTFKQSLSRARTFGFLHEVEALRARGLALGGSLDNAIVVGEDRVLNEDGLRYDDEFIRHKALDCLGDLYLAGCRIDARFTFVKPGHAINNRLLRAIFADAGAYSIADGRMPAPAFPARQAAAAAYA
ncbi:MAG: UDP-3-O-[3-hydroxymyristoyl] N-acetylglucosamine deacetylase [Pseudomonadota bacterium]|nr:UDP-3-O-[3-hydroxymyristoyl] N-acetylglucosamine deacetylase [Pseudomonadota bacterium]MDE3038505.1 UDP-3-O-[3-hydroxymyristoyl] N-acetylglucosamine deacetylase [Pseudomonadota bacterium]